MLKHIPNLLTIARFLLIPIIIIFAVQDNYVMAIIFLTLSGITDILDGFIARKYNLITDFGKLIDPLADKLTQVSILTVLVIKNIIPFWILAIVLLKEFLMVSGASFLYGKELVVSSKWYGKLATVLFYSAIVISLLLKQFEPAILANQSPENSAPPLILYADKPLYILAIISTIFSLIMYIKAFAIQGYLKKEELKIVQDEEKFKQPK